MATSGFFTYYDLYGGKPEVYHHQNVFQLLSPTTEEPLPTLDEPTIATTTITTSPDSPIDFLHSVLSTTVVKSSTSSNNKFYQFVQLVPFAYFHWFLLGLAILLALLLIIICVCYCRSCCRKHRRHRKEKKQPFPNFYRYRTANRRAHGYNIFETSVPVSVPSPARPCPPRSVERINNQLLRQGLDAVGSPQFLRTNVSQAKPSGTFSNTASDLLTQIKDRLSTHPSDRSTKPTPSYETQGANMAFTDDSKQDSSIFSMN